MKNCRSSSFSPENIDQLVKPYPTMLFYGGPDLWDGMRGARVVEEEVLAAVWQQRIASMDDVEAVVLETDGSITVIRRGGSGTSALSSVTGMPNR
jgi:uncharacterized membrane protein YcaP (DUF421 family)